MTQTITSTARDRANQLEAKINETRAALAELDAAPKASAREHALAALNEGTVKGVTASELPKIEAQRQNLQATLAGLIDLRVEIEPAILREELAADEERLAEINAKGAPIKKRIDEIPAELDDLRWQLNNIAREADPYQTRANHARIALAGRNSHIHDLRTALTAGETPGPRR